MDAKKEAHNQLEDPMVDCYIREYDALGKCALCAGRFVNGLGSKMSTDELNALFDELRDAFLEAVDRANERKAAERRVLH